MASIVLARLLGPLFLLAGLGLLVNRTQSRKMLEGFLADAALAYFSGALALVAGVAMVNFHNIWIADWRIVITLIGWISVVKGVVLLLVPQAGRRLAGKMLSPVAFLVLGLFAVALGAWLCFVGYVIAPSLGFSL